jgi:raffinose/stachyose/melibiose transport system permease protein
MTTKKIIKPIENLIKTILSIAFLLVYLYPIILILISSIKTKAEMAANPFGIPKNITFEFFKNAFNRMNYLQSALNSSVIVIVAVSISLIITSMAAYAIARKGRRYNILYYVFLSGMLVPFQMTMIPLYKFLLTLHLINKLSGVIFIYLSSLSPFSVFLLTGFVRNVPRELEEASYIDGCGIYRTFFAIVLPLLRSSLATVAVLNAFGIWNDFLMPLLYLQSRQKLTLTVTLANFQGMYFNDWSMIFAGVCLIVVPMLILYLSAQRFIINGITAGAVKG